MRYYDAMNCPTRSGFIVFVDPRRHPHVKRRRISTAPTERRLVRPSITSEEA
jgi:hypothetical protein